METIELQRLASMGNSLRPDWPTRSLLTFLTNNFENRAYGDVAVALAWIATRTKTSTPRLLLEAGAWWKATATDTGAGPRPPKRDEACAECGRRETDHVGEFLGDHPFRPLARQRYAPGDVRNGVMGQQNRHPATQARAAIKAATATICGHGPRCTDCTNDQAHEGTTEGETK